ncbi:50S ribosomal protein L16 [Candidatus Uhrbacteria bacterium]|nr:50S ribosomal protein L16 [Candidatus Uhrbacteria bacterium]
MLLPKKAKYRKWHNPPVRSGVSCRKNDLNFGEFGLKSDSAGWVTSRQIEAARRAVTRYVQRGGKLWIRIFPDRPVTKKGSEVTMGGGKGAVDHYMCSVRSGTILFEIDGVTRAVANEALTLAAFKLPVKTHIVSRSA